MSTPISKNLLKFRKKKDVTQTAVALAIGAPRGTYSSWERGLAEPGIKWLILISCFFGILVDDLVGANSWISIKKTLPDLPSGTPLRVYGKLKNSHFNEDAVFINGRFLLGGIDITDSVTHWRPVPQKPKR